MIIITNSKLVPNGYTGITIYPFIFLRSDEYYYGVKRYKRLVRHELIHVAQQKELLIVFFYLFYALSYLINLIQYRDKKIAYRSIVFEKEAYKNESDKNYLKNRKFWAWVDYLRTN